MYFSLLFFFFFSVFLLNQNFKLMAKNIAQTCYFIKQGMNTVAYFRKFKHAVNYLILNSQVFGIISAKSYCQYTIDLKNHKAIIFTSRSGLPLEITTFCLE